MTTYELDLQVRIEEKINQMSKIHEHSTNLFMEGKTEGKTEEQIQMWAEKLEQIQIWVDMFEDLEAEAEALILIRDVFAS